MSVKRFHMSVAAVAVLLGLPVLTQGCSQIASATGSLCCSDFKPGTDMSAATFNITDPTAAAQFQVFAQAAGDFDVAAAGLATDVTSACQAIALDLGAKADDPSIKGAGGDLANAWCTLAVAQLKAAGAVSGSLTIVAKPPACHASFSAQANCQAKCSVMGGCDVKANPPTCMGGKLSVECTGGCTAMAGATLSCTGSCTGMCTGSCTAMGGVDCQGKCDGTCSAGGSAGGTGIQADGTCKGMCAGTCHATAPSVMCMGTCDGQCSATCQGSAMASVKCDGKCDVMATPISCEGGTLKASCMVDAHCDANCSASASAKAECEPGELAISASASTQQLETAIATLQKNLPLLLVAVQARGDALKASVQGLVDASGSLAGNAGSLSVEAGVCATGFIAPAIAAAAADIPKSLSAGISITTQIGMPM
jgi:hypothetical protein